MKKLIVSGDSCTDLNFRSSAHPDWDFSFKKWPEHLAEHLGMELVCLGSMGHGNQYIYHSLLDEILRTPKDEIGLVVAGWSQAMRKDYQDDDDWRSVRTDPNGNLLGWVNKTLRHYMSFQILCDRYELPYFHFQMGDLWEAYFEGLRPTDRDVVEGKDYKLIYPGDKNDDIKIIERINSCEDDINNFIGWPPIQKDTIAKTAVARSLANSLGIAQFKYNLDGFNVCDKVLGANTYDQIENELILSELDDHPNEAGHKAIADFLIEELEL